MGKSKKPKVTVDFYYMSLHFGICASEPDALLEIKIKEKVAWSGEATTAQKLSINKRELFGGDQKEGGAAGSVYYLPGASDQLMPTALAQKLGRSGSSDCPGFRGIASLFFYREIVTNGFYWSANAPFLPGVWAKLRRAPVGLDPAYALIPNGSEDLTGTVQVSWQQNSFNQTVDDEARMGIGFEDSDGSDRLYHLVELFSAAGMDCAQRIGGLPCRNQEYPHLYGDAPKNWLAQ